MRTVHISLALALLASGHIKAEQRSLSLAQEKRLVRAAIPAKLKRLPAFQIDDGYRDPNRPRFEFFQAIWAGLPNGSVVVGSYAVDPATGDVFDAVSSCNELSTASLRKLQVRIRLQLRLTNSRYHKIKTKGPLCEE
jgi:hypothetical protein